MRAVFSERIRQGDNYFDVCFYAFPFAPTPEGRYSIKDLAILIATLAIVTGLREERRPAVFR